MLGGEKDMKDKVHRGCQEGKMTPKLTEVYCPRCGSIMEIFVKMGGGATETGRLVSDESCPDCGYVAEAGTPAQNFREA